MKKYLYLLLSIGIGMFGSCNEIDCEYIAHKVTAASTYGSKTAMSNNSINFTKGETLSVIVTTNDDNDIINRFYLKNSPKNYNYFEGGYSPARITLPAANFYAIYPGNCENNGLIFKSTLPSIQSAPFDPSSVFMIAKQTTEYNEHNDMALSLSFETLFADLRVYIDNDVEDYKFDLVRSIEISSEKPIAGEFSYSVCHPDDVKIDDSGSCIISTEYERGATVLSSNLTTNIMIRSGNIGKLTVTIQTDHRTLKFYSSQDVVLSRNIINSIHLKTSEADYVKNYKTIACFGDSFTNRGADTLCNYPLQLGRLLGDSWRVSNYGYSGANSLYILQKVEQWRNKKCDSDLVIFYMGKNDNPVDYHVLHDRMIYVQELLESKNDYIFLGLHQCQYWKCPAVLSGKTIDNRKDSKGVSYIDEIVKPYSECGRFVDLYNSVVDNWREWLVESGAYSYETMISVEKEFPGTGTKSDGPVYRDDKAMDWPLSFWYANNDNERDAVHPSKYGAITIAKLVYDKIKELGYLDDDYILDDPSDL